MNLLSLTISKKLFFIFIINTVVSILIAVMVISSFFGLSESIEYNSKVFSKGIEYMLINGKFVISKGELTNKTPGRWIK